jgi:Flp pilus assembly protein TadD
MNKHTNLQQFATHLRKHIETDPNNLDALADLAAVLAQLGQTKHLCVVN